MSKNILIISSSPRRGGNSDLLCDAWMEGARKAGHHVEKIRLAEHAIGPCRGCGACDRPGQACPQNDDMAALLQKMLAADTVVLATPVYFYSVSGQMKTFIDRTVARDRELTGKEFYFIVAAAEDDKAAMQRTIECFRGYLDCLEGAVEKGIVYGVGAWKIGDIRNSPALDEARAMGTRA